MDGGGDFEQNGNNTILTAARKDISVLNIK